MRVYVRSDSCAGVSGFVCSVCGHAGVRRRAWESAGVALSIAGVPMSIKYVSCILAQIGYSYA